MKGFSISERFSSENEHTHLPNPIPQRFKQTRDGAQFQLIKSPRNNKYNFTATYHYDTDDWEIVRADITNTAEITPKTQESTTEYQWGLLVRDYCLPYGYYDFLYITDCDTQTTTVYYTHPYPYEYRYEHTTPSYTSYQECDNYFITMQTGEYKQLKIGSDVNDPLQPEKVMGETVLNTYFKIVDGPQGGYPTEDFRLGRTIRLTVPGTYTLRMYTPDTSEYCRAPYFDTTITYTGGTVSFDYAYAYVCDADSTVGFFYCQAKDGMAPYTYRLYELTNMEGNLLEENSTGSFKGLSNIHVGDMMSLEVGDACGRSYYVNITVTDLSSSRLAWFDGALRVTETCEGSEIDVYISAVEEDFTYHWKGPNGFDVTTPRGHIVIGRGSEPGDYTVEIGNTGCSQTLKDTVTLGILPAPKVEMSYGTNTVCPGQNVTLSFTPTQGTGTITYIIGREINSIDTFYNFSGIVGETASLEYTATSEATFWIHKVEDEICNYTIPEDTVKITLRDVATACDVTVSSPQICFDATAELTASSSTMVKPYTIRWYDNPYQQNVLKTDVIEEGMSDASFTTGKLQADSTLYVTIQDATHCETYTGTVNQWMNMDNGTTPLTCGQSIRLFDDGGSNGNYLSGKYYKHTFTSTDGNLITLSFNSFNTQLNGDVMRVYTGAEVLQDSLLALISGSNLPESLTSNGTSMTIVFVSNSATEAEGWDALVSCSALPAQANIKVLEDLSVTLSISPEMPARYGQSYTLTAVANGGQGSRYEFTWHITDKDYNEIQSSSHELASNTDIYNLDNLTETRNVWVVVKDKSDYPCTTKDKMSNLIQIEIADIALNLELSSTVNEICQGDIPMIVKIKNEGSQTANNVKVKLALPDGMSLTDEADSLILFPEINAQGTVYDTLFIRNEAHVSTSTSMDIRAQIWSCDQGDNNSNWHNWDWTGNPNEADESIYTLTIRPSLDIVNAPGLTVSSADICFGGDATIQAHSNLDYPQHFIWYADAALTQVIKDTTLENNTSIIVSNEFTNITQEGALCYVMVENSNYCPAYTTVDYRTKMQYAPTDTILMHNGSSMVGNADHIRFFDDGGADNNYAPNKRYGYLFTSVDGSPLAIYFDENNYIYNYNNNARIEIYDGESDMTPRIARYTNSQMRDKVLVATTGKMFIKFYSDDYTDQGISAHVFTTSRAMVAEADVTFKTPMAASEITTVDAEGCYGNEVTLLAFTNLPDYPQIFSWYDENANFLGYDTVNTGETSEWTIENITNPTIYYVSVSNATECPVFVDGNILLNQNTSGVTSIVANNTIRIYSDGSQNDTHGTFTRSFRSLSGPLYIEFEQLSMDEEDTLYIFDGLDDQSQILAKIYIDVNGNGSLNHYNHSYTSPSGLLTFKFIKNGRCCINNWSAKVSTHAESYSNETTVLLNEANNGQSTMVVPNETIDFYDEGGRNGSYQPNADYAHTFKALQGNVNIYFPNCASFCSEDTLYVYEGETVNGELLGMLGNWNGCSSPTMVSTSSAITVRFKGSFCTASGWQAKITAVNPQTAMAQATVTVKAPIAASEITTTDDQVCYGENATLTASTPNLAFPQTHYWYDENLNPVDTITVEAADAHSTLPISSVTSASNYYVTVSNADECPVPVENNQMVIEPLTNNDLQLNTSTNGRATNITNQDVYAFYDEGGANNDYFTHDANWTHTFTATDGGEITLFIKSFESESCCDYMRIYDGASTSGAHMTELRGANSNLTYTSTTGSITIFWHTDVSVVKSGWDALVYTSTSLMAKATASVKAGAPESIITTNEVAVCFGSDAVLNASSNLSTYPQYFYWYNADRTEIVHRDIVENPGESSSYSFTPTSETFYYVTVTNSDNCPIDESQLPQDTNNLVKIKVTFSEPVISNNVMVNDATACYGESVTLNAITNDGTEKHIYWYDENFHLINDKIGTSSTIEPQVSGTTVYYVNAVETNECGILPPSYGKFFFDASKNGGTTNLTTGEMIPFYDAGGPNENYNTPGADWTHTFVAPAGKQVTLKMNSYYTSGHRLFIYDGNTNNLRREFNGNYGENMNEEPITSTTGKLIVRWFIDYNPNSFNYPGWEGEIGVLDANGEMHVRDTELATAHVSMKSIADQLASITTTDATVCYGSEATLTASSTIDYPQTFYWFNSSRDSILKQQTIDSGHDSFTTLPTTEGSYYVYVTNSQNCPLPTPIHDEHIVVNMGNSATNSYTLNENNIIDFYDDGGINGNYSDGWGDYYYFYAPAGTKIHIHFNSIQLEENNNAYLKLALRKADESYEYKYIYGTLSDTDFVSEGNYVQVYFWNNGNEVTAPGWDGYIYAETPIDIENLVAANVTFEQPTFSQNVSTNDVEACYGDEITLTASNIGSTSRYAWYDENYNLIKDTIGQYGTLDVTAIGNATYYVNASAADECPVMPPHYGEFWFDESKNGDTTYLTEGTAISFYDAGGPNANYNAPNGANWTHYFVAPAGKEVTLKLNNFYTSCNHYLLVLDGFPADYSPSSYSCDQGQLNQTIHCTTGVLTIQWYCNSYDNNTYPGWEGLIGVQDANNEMRMMAQPDLAAANVSIKAPLGPNEITTTDGVACYGQPTTLTAKTAITGMTYPQYYTWFDETLTAVGFDTLYNDSEVSSYTVPQVTGQNDYYVTMSNADNCSVVFTKEVLLNESANGGTTILDGQSNYRFCDEGGSAGYYNYNNSWYGSRTHTFTNTSGSVYVTFDREMEFQDNDRLYIYDGTSENGNLLYTITRDVISSMPLTFQSNTNSLTFKFEHYSWGENKGWSALVATTPIAPNQREIRLNRNMNNQTTIVNSGEVVNFYDEGGVNGYFCLDGSDSNNSITHTFTAASGKLQIAFKNYINIDAIRMLIYDGAEANSDNLITEYRYYNSWSSENTPVFTSTGSSLTIKIQMDYSWNTCPEGWRAEISTTVPDMAIASTSVKVVDPATIATTGAEICYGDSATLTASSEIAVPQYYFWYGPDRMDVVKYDTVWTEGTHSEFSVLTGMEETYYVTVTNDTTCPFVEPIHNHVKNVVVAENFQTSSIYVELASNDSVVFYDAGGPDGNIDFRNNNNSSCWDQSVYFTAENGSYIHVHLDYLDGGSSDARFTIYDEENGREIAYFRKSAIDKDYVIKSTRVRLSFSNDCDRKSFPGWLGSVYAVSPRDVSELAEARVRFKAPVGPSTLTTNDPVEVCYGSDVTLTASSTLDADQYFTWYDSDRINILKRDTIHTQGQNSWVTLTPEEEGNYYVAVTNANNCPIIENLHTHYAEVLIGNNYQLLPYDSIGFFDDGGRNNNYAANSSSRSSNFTAEDGSHIRIHIDTISLSRRAYLRIRDEENNLVIATFNGPIDTANLDYIIESNRVYCYFYNDKSNLTAMGWEGYVYAITPHNEEELVEVNIEFMDPDIVDANDVDVTNAENVCYGETVTLTATVSGSEPQHFVWYDEESYIVKEEVTTGSSSFTVVATEEAYYYVNVSGINECPILSPDDNVGDFNLPYGHISLKAGVPGAEITTTDDEVCFGGEAALTATSTIAFPQYYTWYAPDRITILKQETVTAGGHSTLTVTPDEETDYYVAITNDENCPIVNQIHNHYVEILMDGYDSYSLSPSDSVGFFDAGGENGNYLTGWSGDYNFYAEEGSKIRIHFDTVQLARDAYIQIYDGDNNNSTVAHITGSRGNLDYTVESNRLRVYFSGYSDMSAPGWKAYVYSLNPRDENELAAAHVSFMQPTFNSSQITTTNAEACLGGMAELTAISTLTSNQYFAWYDNEMNLLKQEVIPSGEYSELPVEVLTNTTYYVNVSTENECPALPPHYGEFCFDASQDGRTTFIETGHALNFYDDGGENNNYSDNANNWTHIFKAPSGGHVRIVINSFYTEGCDYLYIYDGSSTDVSPVATLSSNQGGYTYTSTSESLTVKWYSDGSVVYAGWDALIGVPDVNDEMVASAFELKSVGVTVIQPTLGLPVTTTNDTVCYGSEAHLTATSTIDYPQYYTWYAPDAHTVLLRDTVDGSIKTESSLNAPNYYQYQDQQYYVALGNGDNCPPVIAEVTNTKTVLLNSNAHEQTTQLAPNEVAKFYDAGGRENSYHDHNSDYTHTFQVQQGKIKVKFTDNNMSICSHDTLYVYDSDHADDSRLLGKVINERDDETDQRVMNYNNLSYYSTGRYMTFQFKQGDNSWCSGWNATVMPYNIESELTTAEVNVKISSVPEMSITTRSDTVCYGSAATVSASANLQYPQYYTWYNNQMEALMHDTLFDASETESVLNLPAHYINENYYAYVYSDTVSCIMDMDAMPKRYSEVYLSNNMDGGETLVTPYDSIRFFNADNLHGLNTNNSTYVDYYFTAESGQIQIKFDELTCNGDCYMAFIVDDINDIGFGELGRGTWQNYTVTSLNNTMHLHLYMYRSTSYAQWRATVTNVNANNTAVLSKMALADVVVEVNNSAATLRTTNDTVCIGSPAMLTASSDIAYPQYYTWYNEDLSSILFEDTIASGSSNFYIPGQVGNATYYAMASNDTTCTLRPVKIHDNFREYIFDDNLAGKSLFVGATDSIVIYDDGGKYGDYIVSEEEYVRIMKLETYPGATITAQVTSLEIDSEEDVMLAFVNGDEQGNLNPGYEGENVVSLTGTLSNTYTYRSEGNVLYIGWIMEDEDALPMAGFEMTVTADMHPESYLAEAQVIMRNGLPMDYNAITDATSTVICKGDDATLEATSNLTENPQYFLWYSSDLSRVIGADTVYSGSTSHVSIPNLMQDTLLYVAVGTDAVCPAYPMEHKLIRELNLNTTTNAHTTQLTAVDSVLFFDDGGKNSHYTFTRGYLSHTFKANSGHVVFNLHELSITDCDDENFLAVVDGEFDIENVDEDSIRAMYYAEEIPTGDSIIISTGNTLSIVFVSDHMHEEEPNNGWYASIYTTEQMSSDMGTVTPAEVTVNPSYQFEVYDTTNASRAPYSTADNMFRNIDVSAEGELIIDSVFHTALGCDSTYTLHLMVLPATVQDIVIASNSNSWTYDGWYHREEVYTVVYGLDTLTADAGSDGKVFTMPGTGDILTITPDATAEVIYFTPTPVPNSFSYTLDNEADYPSVTTDTGTLEITPIATEITITANSASKYYDGTPLTNDGFTYTPTDILVEGDTLVAEIVGTITEIGDSLNRVVSYQVLRNVNFNRRGLASYTQDVTNCYTFALPVSGTLSIVDTFTVSCEVVNGGRICPGSNDGTATITIEGGKDVSPDRYEYSIVGDNTGYNNTGHTEGEIILNTLSPDSYTVTATDALGLTATATFSIVERPVITTTTVFECPNNIDTVIKHSGCNITLMDIGTPNFVAPAGMDMADVTIYNNAPADHIYEVGETTVTWVAKGMCGDSVTCDQIIKVSFQTCPDAVDFEGNSYPSVRLGSGCKCWTTENLVSTKYSDGRDIDDVMDYYSYEYPDVATNVSIFGHLYNWYSAADTARYGSVDSVERAYHSGNHIQGICPDGWYLPSDEEYDELNIYPTTDLRSTEYWIRVNGVVNTNATGFNSLPGGMYNCSTGRFESMMGNSYYWTCHPVYDLATGAMIDYICEKIVTNNNSRCNGYSIRCIWGEH